MGVLASKDQLSAGCERDKSVVRSVSSTAATAAAWRWCTNVLADLQVWIRGCIVTVRKSE